VSIRILNGATIDDTEGVKPSLGYNPLVLVQALEYIRAFLVGRLGWDYLKSTTIISGAFGLFRKDIVLKVGGYNTNTLGEDIQLGLRMISYCMKNKIDYNLEFLPDPICWTEAPEDLKSLRNQRSRWTQGLLESLLDVKMMFFRPWAGRYGFLALPYLLLYELVSAPLELISYFFIVVGLGLGRIDPRVCLLFFIASVLYGWILSVGSVIIEESTFRKYQKLRDYFKLIVASLFEQLGFRQIHLLWRLRGISRWFVGTKSWGKIKRLGSTSN